MSSARLASYATKPTAYRIHVYYPIMDIRCRVVCFALLLQEGWWLLMENLGSLPKMRLPRFRRLTGNKLAGKSSGVPRCTPKLYRFGDFHYLAWWRILLFALRRMRRL
jgi:hypothetical protein